MQGHRRFFLYLPPPPPPLFLRNSSVFRRWNFHRVQVELVESVPGMPASIESD